MLQEVTVQGTQWTCSKQGNKTCCQEFLTKKAKVWFYFICHSLMPTGHTSSLNIERIFLLACIVKGRSINVGKLICEQIRACANKKSGEMFFPTLIYLLCKASRVVLAMEDNDYYSQGTISTYNLSTILPTPSTYPLRASSQTPSAQTPFMPSSAPTNTSVITLAQVHEQQQLYWHLSDLCHRNSNKRVPHGQPFLISSCRMNLIQWRTTVTMPKALPTHREWFYPSIFLSTEFIYILDPFVLF